MRSAMIVPPGNYSISSDLLSIRSSNAPIDVELSKVQRVSDILRHDIEVKTMIAGVGFSLVGLFVMSSLSFGAFLLGAGIIAFAAWAMRNQLKRGHSFVIFTSDEDNVVLSTFSSNDEPILRDLWGALRERVPPR